MATERLTISCDDCMMAGTTACADCLVTFVVGGPLQVLPGGGGGGGGGGNGSGDGELEQSLAAHPAGRARADRPAPAAAPTGPTAEPPRVSAPVGAAGGPRRVRLSAEQADAVRTLAGAGLVGAVRFVPRAAG